MNMNSHDWCTRESDISFEKIRHVKDIIHQNFRVDFSVHIGIIYVAIGCNAGKLTERYLFFVPYYNPSVNGYNFNIQHPYIFARGFASTVSVEFYEWIDKLWIDMVQQNAADSVPLDNVLLDCSPMLIADFDNGNDSSFNILRWEVFNRSDDKSSMSIFKGALECWIHGPLNSQSFEKCRVNQIKVDFSVAFMEVVNRGSLADIAIFMEKLMENSNNFSFPTIQIRMTSPMTGLVPFDLKAVRFKLGGAADRDENVVHKSVYKLGGHEARRISFQRLWGVLLNTDAYSNTCSSKDLCELVRRHLHV